MFGDNTTPCVSFSFIRSDLLGHVLIQVTMELDDGAPLSEHNCCFYVKTELGLLHSFALVLPTLLNKNDTRTVVSLNPV